MSPIVCQPFVVLELNAASEATNSLTWYHFPVMHRIAVQGAPKPWLVKWLGLLLFSEYCQGSGLERLPITGAKLSGN
jgi:hypothetical protein